MPKRPAPTLGASTSPICPIIADALHTDGGLNWTPQEVGIIGPLSSLDLVDGNIGWAVGSIGTILHTADGGLTWRKQQRPIGFAALSAVDFVDAKNGWAVGGGLFEGTVILKYCEGP